jgi:hypothetical protein
LSENKKETMAVSAWTLVVALCAVSYVNSENKSPSCKEKVALLSSCLDRQTVMYNEMDVIIQKRDHAAAQTMNERVLEHMDTCSFAMGYRAGLCCGSYLSKCPGMWARVTGVMTRANAIVNRANLAGIPLLVPMKR